MIKGLFDPALITLPDLLNGRDWASLFGPSQAWASRVVNFVLDVISV